MNVDKALNEIEAGLSVPGTQLTRVLMDVKLMQQYGLKKKRNRGDQSQLVWCLAFGELMADGKTFFYGHSLKDLLTKVHEWRYPQGIPDAG